MLYLGVLGFVLIVAGREYLLALIGRVLIATGHIYAPGDWIESGDVSGKIVRVGVFRTRIARRTTAGAHAAIVSISNAMIFRLPLFVLSLRHDRKEQ